MIAKNTGNEYENMNRLGDHSADFWRSDGLHHRTTFSARSSHLEPGTQPLHLAEKWSAQPGWDGRGLGAELSGAAHGVDARSGVAILAIPS
jgi:hypothetical protein